MAVQTAARKEKAAKLMETDTVKSLKTLGDADRRIQNMIHDMKKVEKWAKEHDRVNLEWKKEVLEGFRQLNANTEWGQKHLTSVFDEMQRTTAALEAEAHEDRQQRDAAPRED